MPTLRRNTPAASLPTNPRSRKIYEKEKWTGYDVMLDVHPDVFAWGVLLLPKDLKPGERRPVVVCQHGLEGVPADTINDDPKSGGYGAYKAFAARLAERGFIVFAPHNPYRGQYAFRVLQRKANPLGLSLFSIILAQHERILDWLVEQPFVDPKRIGFYGLSYGGKTAMRVPSLLDRYCLSICSADFNEWATKCATTDSPYSYLYTVSGHHCVAASRPAEPEHEGTICGRQPISLLVPTTFEGSTTSTQPPFGAPRLAVCCNT